MRLKVIYRLSLPMLAVFAAANVILAIWVYTRLNSPIEYKLNVIEAPRIEFPDPPTNVTRASSSLIPERVRIIDSPPRENVPERHQMPYHYCVVSGRRVAYLNGVYCREGDKHAFGVISAIYPERIYFEGGNYIDNTTRRGLTNDNGGTVDPVAP